MSSEIWVTITHKAILFNLARLYQNDMTPLQLYEAVRGTWIVGERRYGAEYAMAVYKGIVREVYKIDQWYPAGTLEYKTRDSSLFKMDNRYEFTGEVADDIRDEYVDFYIGKSGQNPIRYMNV
ncbi:MAG: hypothetical protein ACYCZF_16340 [Anaerolineae bacterium]